jgi:hypothetical protein
MNDKTYIMLTWNDVIRLARNGNPPPDKRVEHAT